MWIFFGRSKKFIRFPSFRSESFKKRTERLTKKFFVSVLVFAKVYHVFIDYRKRIIKKFEEK
jgi:hypothetical protein